MPILRTMLDEALDLLTQFGNLVAERLDRIAVALERIAASLETR